MVYRIHFIWFSSFALFSHLLLRCPHFIKSDLLHITMETQVTWTEQFERDLYKTDAFKQRRAEASARFAPWFKICEAQPPYQHLPDSDEEEEVDGLLTPPTSVHGVCNTIPSSAFLDSSPIDESAWLLAKNHLKLIPFEHRRVFQQHRITCVPQNHFRHLLRPVRPALNV